MSFGQIEYNEDGLPMCEICGKHFHRVISHVRQKHQMTAFEYKETFGLNNIKGVCSQASSDKTRKATMSNFDKVVTKNLLQNGKNTRFEKGSKGRTKEKVREQTKSRLISHIKEISK